RRGPLRVRMNSSWLDLRSRCTRMRRPRSAARSERSSVSKKVLISRNAPMRWAPRRWSCVRSGPCSGTFILASISTGIVIDSFGNGNDRRLIDLAGGEVHLPLQEWKLIRAGRIPDQQILHAVAMQVGEHLIGAGAAPGDAEK